MDGIHFIILYLNIPTSTTMTLAGVPSLTHTWIEIIAEIEINRYTHKHTSDNFRKV